MTFLNIALLGGLAAASIPILIHIFSRSRYRVVKWGAMHLLDSAFRTNTRRLRLEQLLLLLLRCAIPILLALCLARPVLTGIGALVGAARTSLVILLDNSYSMEAGGSASGNFSQARQAAHKMVEDLGRGSDAAVVLMAGGAGTLLDGPSFDLARINRELTELDAGFGKADVPASLETAAGWLAKMQHPFRELIIISDLQRVSWSAEEAPVRERAVELLQKIPLPPQVTLFHTGAEVRDNVSVESLDFSRLVFGIGQPLQVRANLRNFGERSYPELRVYFRVDGKERSAAQIALGAQEQQQVLFTHTFETAGSHVIEVYAEADPLQADNSFQASIPVWDRLPVLLVNGDPSIEPLKGETDFLEIALQPFGVAKADLTDLIQTRVVTLNGLTAETLTPARVLVLANVRQLADAQLKFVTQFVRDGGGLLVFPGNRINTDWYNRVLAAGDGLLPLPLLSLAGSADESAPAAHIVAGHYAHPAMEMFNDPRNGNLADGEIRAWYQTKEKPDDPAISVLARLDSGDVFLAEKKFGEGRVIQCTTPGDADWSNLPLRPFYLPLMQRLTTYLGSTVFPPRNVDVGKPLIAFFGKGEAGRHAQVTDPAGNKHEITVVNKNDRSVMEFTATQRPGLYLVNGPDGSVVHFVVNTSRDESDLAQLSVAERTAMAKSLGGSLVTSIAEYKQQDQHRRFGREVWRPIFWAVLALLFVELVFQQSLARRK